MGNTGPVAEFSFGVFVVVLSNIKTNKNNKNQTDKNKSDALQDDFTFYEFI